MSLQTSVKTRSISGSRRNEQAQFSIMTPYISIFLCKFKARKNYQNNIILINYLPIYNRCQPFLKISPSDILNNNKNKNIFRKKTVEMNKA